VSDSVISHSPDLIPVLVALMLNLKQLSYSLLVKLILWPRTVVAVYGKRITGAPPPVEPPSPVSAIPTSSTENQRMNYVLQVMQRRLLLMQLNDTETEGDGERSLRNKTLLMFYFRAQPRGMKCAFEAMHFTTFVIGSSQ